MANLQENISDLIDLYGPRNAMFLRTDMRAALLYEKLRDLCKELRKGQTNKDVLSGIMASLFARSVCLSDSFHELPIVDALCSKYGANYCQYCGKHPCRCEKDRTNDISYITISNRQRIWSVTDWTSHLHELYGKNNTERGIDHALLRLSEEMHEVQATYIFEKALDNNFTLSMRREALAREFADVFAWIFSITGMLDLDLQSAIEHRYGAKCRECNQKPCNCPSPILRNRNNPVGEKANSTVAT